MKCRKCKGDFSDGDICSHCGTDNHDYTIDWITACEGMIFD